MLAMALRQVAVMGVLGLGLGSWGGEAVEGMDHAADALVAVLDGVAALAQIVDAGMHGHGAGVDVEGGEGDPFAGGLLEQIEDDGALAGSGGDGGMVHEWARLV